jgi:hypothetical protein
MKDLSFTVAALACAFGLCATPAPAATDTSSLRDRIALNQQPFQPDAPFLAALGHFDGERVLIPIIHLDAYENRPVAPAAKLLGRLQNFCETFAPRDKGDQPDMIPFGVREPG